MGQEWYMYMLICDMYECLNAYTLIIDYNWCEAYCLYEWVDGVQA